MIAQEFHYRSQHRGITKPCSQSIGIEPGEIKKPLRTRLVFKDPAKRRQYQRMRLDLRLFGG